MDIDQHRIGPEDPLKRLFQEPGHFHAPADLQERIMARRVDQKPILQPDTPLIARRTWVAIAVFLIACLSAPLLWTAGDASNGGVPPHWLSELFRSLDLASILRAPAIRLTLIAVVLLLVMDQLIQASPARLLHSWTGRHRGH
jgi:hypothetical protein